MYLYLPLAHSLARIAQAVALRVGGTLAFWGGDPKRTVDEVAEAAPTHFPSVPRVYEKIHTAVLAQVAEQGRLRRAVFGWALAGPPQPGHRARWLDAQGQAGGRAARLRRPVPGAVRGLIRRGATRPGGAPGRAGSCA